MKIGITLVLSFMLVGAANASTMLAPVSATSSVGSFNTYSPDYTIDQSGMTAAYTSGVTDLASFAATTTSALGGSSFNGWFAPANTSSGNIDFDLGGLNTIDAFALWNDYQPANQGILNFNLLADDNSAFSSPTLLGNFNAADLGPIETNNIGQVFGFSATTASHVRLEILSNQGSTFTVGFNEAAFGTTVIPLPPAAWLFGSALLGLGVVKRRKA